MNRAASQACPALLLSTLVTLAPPARAAPAARPRLALLGVTAGDGVGDKTAATAEEILLNALYATERFEVVGRSDIANLIGFERQKQLAGCKEDVSCAAEIAGALGVPYVASAGLGRLGTVTVVSLKIIDVTRARVVARAEARPGSDAELPAALDRMVASAVAACEREGCFGRTSPPGVPVSAPVVAAAPSPVSATIPAAAATPVAPEVKGRSHVLAWSLAGLAAATALAGGVVGWQARDALSADKVDAAGTHSLTQVEAQRAGSLRLGANVLFGCATALGVGAGVAFVF